jgi:hypothetical protein
MVDGRMQVAVPWKAGEPNIPSSRPMAEKRLTLLLNSRKYVKTFGPHWKDKYWSTFQGHIDSGFLDKIDPSQPEPENVYYIPHFGVEKDSETTPLRNVLDSAAQTRNGKSLNDTMFIGPNLMNDLPEVLTEFRLNVVAWTVDVKEMFLRIRMDPKDRGMARILWRHDGDTESTVYQYNCWPFGYRPAPFVAVSTDRANAIVHKKQFPLAEKAIRKDTVIDDSVSSSKTPQEAIEVLQQLTAVRAKIDMPLRKYASNNKEVLSKFPKAHIAKSVDLSAIGYDPLDATPNVRTLGMLWLSEEDVFTFFFKKPITDYAVTKRGLLRAFMTFYDPWGLASPAQVVAKVIFQNTWINKYDWDDPLTEIGRAHV